MMKLYALTVGATRLVSFHQRVMQISLIVSFSTKENTVTDSGCTVDLYGCASCHKVWMEDDSINVDN